MAEDFPLFGPPKDAKMGGAGDKKLSFPHPWLDYASTVMPKSMSEVLRWAEFIWCTNGTYRQACQRTARYFITSLQIGDADDQEAKSLKESFDNDVRLTQQLSSLGDNFLCYGNAFFHPSLPFKRYLVCPCGFLVPLREAHRSKLYEWKEFKFLKTDRGCPSCGRKHNHVPWQIHDTEIKDLSRLRLRMLNPHEMEMAHSPYSDRKTFFWNLPSRLIDGVKKGVMVILEDLPKEILDTIADGERQFEFDEGVLFHQSDATVSGIDTGGWGLPRVLSNFRLAFQYQVLNRYDQAIAMDYINGIRVISPSSSGGGNGAGDPLIGIGGGQFSTNVQKILKAHKSDPNTWHTSPIPLQYQLFGGEGTQLSPRELMQAKLDELLDATGVPAELYHGSLSIQAMPTALRIFENSWPEVTSLYNNAVAFIADYCASVLRTTPFKLSLMPVTMADDAERRHIMLQLMAGQQVSPQTALAAFGIDDPRDELRKTFQWQRMTAEEEKAFEEDMSRAAAADQIKQEWQQRSMQANMGAEALGGMPAEGGAPPPGGMPPGGAPMDPGQPSPDALSTPESMEGEAQRLAEEIIGLDPTERRRRLVNLKHTNETLHALVKARIDDMEQMAKQQGVTMLRQQGQMM